MVLLQCTSSFMSLYMFVDMCVYVCVRVCVCARVCVIDAISVLRDAIKDKIKYLRQVFHGVGQWCGVGGCCSLRCKWGLWLRPVYMCVCVCVCV
jgi:hypothetical protein